MVNVTTNFRSYIFYEVVSLLSLPLVEGCMKDKYMKITNRSTRENGKNVEEDVGGLTEGFCKYAVLCHHQRLTYMYIHMLPWTTRRVLFYEGTDLTASTDSSI